MKRTVTTQRWQELLSLTGRIDVGGGADVLALAIHWRRTCVRTAPRATPTPHAALLLIDRSMVHATQEKPFTRVHANRSSLQIEYQRLFHSPPLSAASDEIQLVALDKALGRRV